MPQPPGLVGVLPPSGDDPAVGPELVAGVGRVHPAEEQHGAVGDALVHEELLELAGGRTGSSLAGELGVVGERRHCFPFVDVIARDD